VGLLSFQLFKISVTSFCSDKVLFLFSYDFGNKWSYFRTRSCPWEQMILFQNPLMSVSVARKAAQDWAATHHSSLPPQHFAWVKSQMISSEIFSVVFPPCSPSFHWPFPCTFSSKICLGRLCWSILLTWPKHQVEIFWFTYVAAGCHRVSNFRATHVVK